MKCLVCDREAKEKYCMFHEAAYRNVVQKFETWKQATGASWKEYLKALVENAYTGYWQKKLQSLLKADG